MVPDSDEKETGPGQRAPRRIVLLQSDETSDVDRVLAEFAGEQISGRRLHVELQKRALEHPERTVAGEWLGPLGWTRFLWVQKGD